MEHRHLETDRWTLAAIDDVIARGRMADWKDLRDAAAEQVEVRERIRRVCAAQLADPMAQRHRFWETYVRHDSA